MGGTLRITSDGATGSPFAFALKGLVPLREKPVVGELQRAAATIRRDAVYDAPWSITSFDGIGVNLAADSVRNRDSRAWVSENVMTLLPSFTCLGPNKRTTTFPAEVAAVEFRGFFHAIGELFMFGTGISTAETADEALLYWDNTNWADTTAKDDLFDAAGGTPAGTMIVSGGCEHVGRAYICLRGTLLNTQGAGSSQIQVARSNVGSATVWNIQSLVSAANPISNDPYFILSDGVTMYVTDWNSSTSTAVVRNSADDGALWPNTDATILASGAPRGAVLYGDGTATPVSDYWVTFPEGLYHVDVSANTFTKRLPFLHPESVYTGQIKLTPFGILVSDGPSLYLCSWETNGAFVAQNLTARLEHGWSPLKRGDITAIGFDEEKNWVLMAKGGDASGRNAGVYAFKLTENVFLTEAGSWHNIYYNATANRVIFALEVSTETAGTPNLHIAEDNATADDSDAFRFQDYNKDPRTVASYQHTSTGELILPKNDRGVRELVGTWRKVEAWGTGFDANNYLTAYHSADAAPIDSDGSWTQLEDSAGSVVTITSSGGVAYFPATTDTTGLAARAEQIRIKFTGTSNASPYLEIFNTYVRKLPAAKFIYTYTIDLVASAAQGTVQARQKLLTDLRNIVLSTTDLQVKWGEEAATLMEPWRYEGGAIQYEDATGKVGTVNPTSDVKEVRLVLAEV